MSYRIRDYRTFTIAFIVLYIVGLFLPLIELHKGTVSLGHFPLLLAYFGIFETLHWKLATTFITGHLVVVFVVAWLATLAIQSRTRMPT